MNNLLHTASKIVSKNIRHTYLKVSTNELQGNYGITVTIDHEDLEDGEFVFTVDDVTDEIKKLKKKTRTLK